MAAGGNALAQQVMAALQARAIGGGAEGGDPGAQYSEQMSELQGADPGMVLRQLEQIRKVLAALFVQSFQRLPNVAGQIQKVMTDLSKAIKEAQQAASTQQAVRPGIGLGAAEQPPQAVSGGGGGFGGGTTMGGAPSSL